MCNCLTADKEEDSEEDGEVEYQHIPLDERLPSDLAAPCLQHLLSGGKASTSTSTPTPPQEPKAKKQKVEKPVAKKKKPVTKSPVESDDDDESEEEQAKQIGMDGKFGTPW